MILKHLQLANNIKNLTNVRLSFSFCDTPYKVPYNINRQQHRPYLKRVEKAEKILQQSQVTPPIPRRKRRIYDRPRHDLDITDYHCFRFSNPQQTFNKIFEHSLPVVTKINIQPKWLIHAFGRPNLPDSNPRSSTGQYVFRDTEMGSFLLYDYRYTTAFKQNVQGYDYENQSHIRPGMRLIKRLTPKQFWESEEYFLFRVNASRYASHFKFKEWIKRQLQQRKQKQSYDDYIDKKFGPVHTFNLKEEAQYFVKKQPMLRYVSPKNFTVAIQQKKQDVVIKIDKKKKKQKGKDKQTDEEKEQQEKEIQIQKKQQPLVEKPDFKFSKKLEDQYRVSKQQGTDFLLGKRAKA